MKSLAYTLTLLILMATAFPASAHETKDGNGLKKTTALRNAVQKQINKYLFFPIARKENLVGTAEVMLQVYPGGELRVIYLKSENALVRNFIERQVARMKVDPEKVISFEVFRFRFSFKRQS